MFFLLWLSVSVRLYALCKIGSMPAFETKNALLRQLVEFLRSAGLGALVFLCMAAFFVAPGFLIALVLSALKYRFDTAKIVFGSGVAMFMGISIFLFVTQRREQKAALARLDSLCDSGVSPVSVLLQARTRRELRAWLGSRRAELLQAAPLRSLSWLAMHERLPPKLEATAHLFGPAATDAFKMLIRWSDHRLEQVEARRRSEADA